MTRLWISDFRSYIGTGYPVPIFLEILSMVRTVQARFNPNLKIAGILLTMYQSRPQLCQNVCSGVAEVYGTDFHVFERPIEYTIKIAECPAAGKRIFDWAALCVRPFPLRGGAFWRMA
ncbi:MAG: ParA family protein [Oscillibacter sp.]|nr:ParA family protein [Oscillibacter sp.]